MDNHNTYRRESNPKDTTNIFSKLLFLWCRRIFSKCIKHDYNFADLCECSSYDKANDLTNVLESEWNYEIIKARSQNKNPRLLRAIRKTFFWRFACYSILFVFNDVIITPLLPVLLSKFIHLFSTTSNTEYHTRIIYIYGGLIILVSILKLFINNHLAYAVPLVGTRIRVACSSLIYRKVLRCSTKSLNKSSSGQVINLLTYDVSKFDMIMSVNHILSAPFLLLATAAFAWTQMQISGIIGLGLFALTIPLQALSGKLIAKLSLQLAEQSDLRIGILSEIFVKTRFIKIYAWEKPFAKLVNGIRVKEIKILKKLLSMLGMALCSWTFTARLILFATVTSYTLFGHEITAAKVFSILLIFNILQEAIGVLLPISVNDVAETLVSIKRLEEFLLLEEKGFQLESSSVSGEIILKDISISWGPDLEVLHNLNIAIKPGRLCAVIGPVGAGKSTLLQFLLGELLQDRGTFSIGGQISYASQESWLFASTAKRNILFGQEYEENRYRNVVNACSLKRDFKNFPQSDETLVLEKGISLSGGQKARVSLARAVYRKADIYLLDDPLSAVDPHVGKELFEKCIVDYLKGKTRILVTHQLQYLKNVDHIVVLNEGRIEAQGTYEELSSMNVDFTKLLKFPEGESQSKLEKNRDTENSSKSGTSTKESENFMEDDYEEESNETTINPKSTFMQYINSGHNKFTLLLIVLLLLGAQVLGNCSDLWLTFWTQHTSTNPTSHNNSKQFDSRQNPISNDNLYYFSTLSTNSIMIIYAAILLTLTLLTIIACILFYNTITSISYNLHNNMYHSLLNAPINFFDVHPSGKIINRFSRDTGIVDFELPLILHMGLMVTFIVIGSLVVVFISNYYMIVVFVLLSFAFYKIGQWYTIVAKNLKHLESAVKSPVYSYVNATWNGVLTIRSTKMESTLKREFDAHQDLHTSAWNIYQASIIAFGLWIDLLCTFFLTCVVFSLIALNQFKMVNGSYAGLAISQTVAITGVLQMGISQIAHIISEMASVERILEFSRLKPEESHALIKKEFLSSWPDQGKIEFGKVFLRYSPTDAPVLKNLNFTINPGEKIGIVGRTGAGKSSLISVLVRLTPIEGNLFIDDIDIRDISLEDLRSRITIIPQDPALFSASIRYNLDPFDNFSDEEIWNALDVVDYKEAVPSLDYRVDEGGSNFSVGQKQLICLARAILRKNKILVLDEATASIDHKTDEVIQNTIRNKFNDFTVLTIAHRLNTIMDSDKVVVMDAGQIVEYDSPHNLLQNDQGYFYKMVSDSGLLPIKSV